MLRIAFVCLGNICRSPTAEGVFQNLVNTRGVSKQFKIGSFGLGAWHVGNPPDPRAQETAQAHGISIAHQRAEQITSSKIVDWDMLVCMDASVYQEVKALVNGSPKPAGRSPEVCLLTELLPLEDPRHGSDVPDPYYQTGAFEEVFQLIQGALVAFLERKASTIGDAPA